MRSSGYIASLVAAGAMAVPHNCKLQNDNRHYEIVTKFEYVTHYVIGGGSDAPQTTCVSQPKTSNFEKQPDISREYITTAIYAQSINVQPVKRPKQAPNRDSVSGFGPSYGLSTDQQEAVNLHNDARKAVGNGPLSWDDSLAAGAQQWANHLASKGNHGENSIWVLLIALTLFPPRPSSPRTANTTVRPSRPPTTCILVITPSASGSTPTKSASCLE
ncbi:hypothetical protein FOQG_18331 [Fusarium oxysporum f. sp. raphani 54005]|uniref:SCP domain-containing protein n=2 Tax=Fusarium oxysporum f. sp. raphani TaxID=96318 RepID=X0BDP3_FUSOX|nr:hypothetical protein FOQG_18331 [Fusarium oxysporum f. sp. raphani 54005]KAG7415001.1 Pathogenesis-related protein 1 [Fusarium oxysporum f. sp. raphani]